MKWLRELYVGEKAGAKAPALLRAAERGKKSKNDSCYLIVVSSYPNAQLDLITFRQSRSKEYQGNKLTVLGLAADRREAFALVENMANDCLKAAGSVQMKEYFLAQPIGNWREVSV